ncbi:MAG: selenide, water dikinase SelD [Alphaproteobacteria bacterium]|nr:selenide, water dikinase SelD [Alphaproteobacteria bacterium]MCB9929355.1 selenide, water dikinase SelD [Alphaproteobacteria bacterium]
MQGQGQHPVATEIVLVGGGHAHVAVLRMFGMKPEPGVRLTVVARDAFTPYSGMIPGYIAGHYRHADCHIDLGPLCRMAGARLIHAPAVGLDPEARRVQIAGRPALRYDWCSIDTGSVTRTDGIAGAAEFGLPVKPLDRFLSRLDAGSAALPSGAPITVVGGGAGGVELALAIAWRLRERAPRVTLATDADGLLPSHAPAVQQRMRVLLAAGGVELRAGAALSAIEPDAALFADGSRLESSLTVLATGAAPASWLAETGLAVDARGFVRVGPTLASLSHPTVFAAGDVAAFEARPLPKAGVYAVRQGPVLADNLRRVATGQAPRPYEPQHRFLSLLSGGRQTAVASYGRLAASGDWVWRWKDWIDRRWMRRYQELPPMETGPDAAPMRCAGCGSKIGSDVLGRVLGGLDTGQAPGVLMGAGDDAALVQPPPGQVLVQSTDHFRAFTGDAHLFGRIAAEHALSDLFAMGAEAHSALAQVTVPFAVPGVQEADLLQVLAGACVAIRGAGAALIGGHSAEGPELALGLTVNGFAAPDALWRKSGARAGDALVLTKPLGTGVLLAADMQGQARSAWIEAALAGMVQSNRAAVPVLRAHGARAVTDVTGFGLAGHLQEMTAASGVSASVRLAAVPCLPGAAESLAAGIESTLAPANRTAVPHAPPLLLDPQTSGGLLAAVPAEQAPACVAALHAAGYAAAAVIGQCDEGLFLSFDT